ncbi:hypothetical protein F4212_01315 [Candidatus Poribacteria bacterium]|nr:hypothetical protein [Candidatus Poribacteria bacterium]
MGGFNGTTRCKFCDEWIVWKKSKGKYIPCDVSFDDYGNAYPVDKHTCRVSDNDYDPNYVYPMDWSKVLVREGEYGKWQYLGTLVRNMKRRREDKSMMSKNNFRKNWGHR